MEVDQNLPEGFIAEFIPCNGITLHVIHNGAAYQGNPIEDNRKPLLCLHGFPEFWMSWEKLMEKLGKDYFMVIPDQRGYNKSDSPQGAENYTAKILVADVFRLAAQFFGQRSFNLLGHDFGASIAYALVFNFASFIDKFIIINGAHPICLQEALLDVPEQAEASHYFHTLREEGAGEKATMNDFQMVFDVLDQHNNDIWMDEKIKDRYRKAWKGAEGLQAMFNWYQSSPIVVPVIGEPLPDAPLYGAPRTHFRVTVPHLLIWGLKDFALLPACFHSLPEFCDDLIIKEVEDADHWIMHTHAERVASFVQEFLTDKG